MKNRIGRESPKEKKDSFLNKIKKMGKNISIDFADTPTKVKSPIKTSKNFTSGFSNTNNNENWFLFASKAINIQCIEEINQILHAIDLDPKEASEILIFLYQKYQIKQNDIIPLLESQQKKLIESKFEPYFFKRKKKNHKKAKLLGKLLYSIKLSIPYLDIEKDFPIDLLLVSKTWKNALTLDIYERYLNICRINATLKIKIWIRLLNPVRNYFF